MKNFFYAARQVFKFRSSNLVKLLSLSLSLLMGGLLTARVALDRSSDSFYPDVERLYRIESTINSAGEIYENDKVISPLVVAMGDKIPEVEAATRCMSGGQIDYNRDGRFFNLQTLFVDSSFFDVLGFEVISGDARQDLSVPNNAFISHSYAQSIFPDIDPVGQTLAVGAESFTICGVFQDIPINCHLTFDIAVAPKSFLTTWGGGDRYWGYFKLHKGTNPTDVDAATAVILAENIDIEEMNSLGLKVDFHLVPIAQLSTRHTVNANIVMSILALVLILVGGLNYVLLTISSLASRAREVGVHKASGASARSIFALLLWETAIYVLLAVAVMSLILICSRSLIEQIAGGYEYLFSLSNLWSFASTILVIFLVAGIIPAWHFSRISVTQIFRRYNDAKNLWKRLLLFVQFLSAAFIISFLIVIFIQYNKMINRDLGYQTSNVGYVKLSLGTSIEPYRHTADEIARLPFVDKVALANSLPILDTYNGLSIRKLESFDMIMSCGMLQVEPRFFDLFDIPIVDGQVFESSDDPTICVIDEQAASLLASNGISAVGFNFAGDGELQTISGVARNIRLGSAHYEASPVIYTALRSYDELFLTFKLDQLSAAELKTIDKRLRELFPTHDFRVYSYQDRQLWLYLAEKQFRDVVMIASIILLCITLMGVVGYMATEIRRRSREIAIRKVFGASSIEVIALLLRGITLLGLVSSVVGSLIAYVVSRYWQEQFALKAELSVWIFILGVLLIVGLIIVCVFVQTSRIARERPASSIKSE